MREDERSSFSGSIGFVLAAAGSAVGLGNIWRFPYLAAKNDGGLFIAIYIVLALTFGFALLMTEIAIGRMTKSSPLKAYGVLNPNWKWIGFFATLVPFMIFPYYCAIGGWVTKYSLAYLTGVGEGVAADGFFGGFITSTTEPIALMAVFLLISSLAIVSGVNKGIEKVSKVLMPILLLLVIGISLFALTISYTDPSGVTRTGTEGLMVYMVPNLSNLTLSHFMGVLLDAMGQLFFSISVAMGIMVAYGSYFKDSGNVSKSVLNIEFFDWLVAFLAGIMIILPLYVFMGREGMHASGPSLVFVTMPKIFIEMGSIGSFVGVAFFIMVFFAALTSNISILEAIVSSFMEHFNISRKTATLAETVIALILGGIVCLGYNVFYFEAKLPTGSVGQILDIMDFISNNLLMPIVAISTCLLIGWVVGPDKIIAEATKNGEKFYGRALYVFLIKYCAPVLLTILLLRSIGILH
ncbi:MAG: sodium-dependent transporter [Selenomonadaceae bacterium]|nr:sodium-dependent transporter [Selenomonadaceae bacterium]